MHTEIGFCEAQTKLLELLQGVQAGSSYTITLCGEAIAELVQAKHNKAINRATAVAEMKQFITTIQLPRRLHIKALINEDRVSLLQHTASLPTLGSKRTAYRHRFAAMTCRIETDKSLFQIEVRIANGFNEDMIAFDRNTHPLIDM